MHEARKLERLQKSVALCVIMFCVGASSGLWAWGHQLAALVALLAPVALVAVAMAIEQLFSAFVSANDTAAPRPPFSQRLQAWWWEIAASFRIFFIEQPFRAALYPELHPDFVVSQRCPLLFVHGFLCNRGFWNPWRKWLSSEGRVSLAVTLAPAYVSIDQHRQTLEAAFQRLCKITGRPPIVVAHSMGGLAVRAWLAARKEVATPPAVITIGTPHHGTWIARWSRRENGRQMQQGSAWLKNLAAVEATLPRRPRIICFYSNCDNVVFPPSAATLSEARNIHVPGEPHIRLAWSDAVFQLVKDELHRADGTHLS